jgi:hypothetical protein
MSSSVVQGVIFNARSLFLEAEMLDGHLLVTRRDVVKNGAAAITLATSPNGQGFAVEDSQLTVTGVVFEDLSGTGTRQPDDPGIAGVLVSNGREVVKTDSNGRYTLPISDESIVFVIKPTGYALPVDRNVILPRFYYIHQPKGTPTPLGLRYRGIEPTGPLPRSVDFGLKKSDELARFDVLLLTDPHADSSAAIDFIRTDVVNALVGTKAAFGITMGDLMSDDLSRYDRYNRVMGQIGIPWYNIAGNHDLNFEAPDRVYAHETFKRTFGPPYYAFEHGGALFLMLDNVDYLGNGKYQGRFGARQLAFVSHVLRETSADRLVVAAMHIPLRSYLDPNDPTLNTSDGSELLRLIGDRPSISFSGHTHTTEHHYLGTDDDNAGTKPHHHHVITTVSGSWWSGPYDHRGVAVADSPDGNPNGFHILSIDNNRYTTRFRPAKEPETRQMRIVLDSEPYPDGEAIDRDFPMESLFGSPSSQDRLGTTNVVVNFFDGGPRTTVAYRIGDHPPVSMRSERRTDPFVKEVFAKNRATKKPWADVEPCSHIWSARLPADLEAGSHCIEVCVIDEHGREHNDRLCLEVIGTRATGAIAHHR